MACDVEYSTVLGKCWWRVVVERLEQGFHIVGHGQHRKMLRRKELLLAHVGKQLDERIVKARAIEQSHRLQMQAQLQPGERFDHFFKRADAAGQSDKGVGQLRHLMLALVHRIDVDQSR